MAPALRLYSGDDEEPSSPREVQRRYTLREAFDRISLPLLQLKGRAEGTIRGYHTTLRLWERLTSNPPICEITDDTLLRFHLSLPSETHGPRSRNKHTINVEAILRICGPRDSRNKRGRGILDQVPYCERAAEGEPSKRRRVMPDDAFEAFYEGCSVAKWPHHPSIPAPLVWRSVGLLLRTFGPRRTNAFLMPAEALIKAPQHPHDEIDVRNEWGWLSFVPTKTKRVRPQRLILPLNRVLRTHFDRLGPRKLQLFPFAKSTRDWRAWFNRIQEAAGITEPYTFQDLRKTANVIWNRLDKRKSLGRYVLGQMPRDVNTQFYEDFTADVRSAVEEFPYPEIVRSGQLL